MKKLISIVMVMIYSLSISTIAHASTMGFFSHNSEGMHIGHCHSSQKPTSTTQNIDCCELALSSEYTQTQINIKYSDLVLSSLPSFNYIYNDFTQHKINQFLISFSPGRNPDIKYNKFSDLFGIIVSLS